MTSQFTVDGIERSTLVRRPGLKLGSAAYRGEVGSGQVLLDDAAASLAFPALKVARLIEDASGSDKHLYRGRPMIKGYSRGGFVVGDSRQYRITFSDSNWDLRRLRVHQWSRPAETGRARVVALGAYILNGSSSTVTNANKRPSTVIDCTTYVPNTNTATMEAQVYDATDPWQVIEGCAKAEGKVFHVIVDDDGDMFLWFDVATSTSYASTLAISDDAWDLITVFPPIDDGEPSQEDGSELLSGAALVPAAGVLSIVAESRPAIVTAHDVAEETIYDSGANVDVADRLSFFLDERELEETRIACAVRLPADKAHLIKSGMTIAFRMAAAGVTSPVTLRVARCSPEQMDDPLLYLLHLELGFPEKVSARIQNHGRGDIPNVIGGNVVGGTENCADTCQFINAGWFGDGNFPAGGAGEILFDGIDYGELDGGLTAVDQDTTAGDALGTTFAGTPPSTADYTFALGSEGGYFSGIVFLPAIGNGAFQDFQLRAQYPGEIFGPGVVLYRNRGSGPGNTTEIAALGGSAGSDSAYVDLVLPADADETLNFKAHYLGTTVKGKAWRVGDPEPDWQVTTTRGSSTAPDRVQTWWDAGGDPEIIQSAQYDIRWCSQDCADAPPAYFNIWTSPAYVGTADGATGTFSLPSYPAGGALAVTAYINGNYEPSTFDSVNRTITFPNVPEAGDAIDIAWIPTP